MVDYRKFCELAQPETRAAIDKALKIMSHRKTENSVPSNEKVFYVSKHQRVSAETCIARALIKGAINSSPDFKKLFEESGGKDGYDFSNDKLVSLERTEKSFEKIRWFFEYALNCNSEEDYKYLLPEDIISRLCKRQQLFINYCKLGVSTEELASNLQAASESKRRNIKIKEAKSYFEGMEDNTKGFLEKAAKYYTLISNNQGALKESDIAELAILLSLSDSDCYANQYFANCGVELKPAISELFGIDFSKEKLESTPLDTNVLLNKYERYISYATRQKGDKKEFLTINDIIATLFVPELDRSQVLEKVLKSFNVDYSKFVDGYNSGEYQIDTAEVLKSLTVSYQSPALATMSDIAVFGGQFGYVTNYMGNRLLAYDETSTTRTFMAIEELKKETGVKNINFEKITQIVRELREKMQVLSASLNTIVEDGTFGQSAYSAVEGHIQAIDARVASLTEDNGIIFSADNELRGELMRRHEGLVLTATVLKQQTGTVKLALTNRSLANQYARVATDVVIPLIKTGIAAENELSAGRIAEVHSRLSAISDEAKSKRLESAEEVRGLIGEEKYTNIVAEINNQESSGAPAKRSRRNS